MVPLAWEDINYPNITLVFRNILFLQFVYWVKSELSIVSKSNLVKTVDRPPMFAFHLWDPYFLIQPKSSLKLKKFLSHSLNVMYNKVHFNFFIVGTPWGALLCIHSIIIIQIFTDNKTYTEYKLALEIRFFFCFFHLLGLLSLLSKSHEYQHMLIGLPRSESTKEMKIREEKIWCRHLDSNCWPPVCWANA